MAKQVKEANERFVTIKNGLARAILLQKEEAFAAGGAGLGGTTTAGRGKTVSQRLIPSAFSLLQKEEARLEQKGLAQEAD